MEIKNLRRITKRCIDFFFCPNVKRTLDVFAMPGVIRLRRGYGGQAAPGYSWAVGIFGGKKSAFLGCHVAGDVIENVARDRFELDPHRRFRVGLSTLLPRRDPDLGIEVRVA